MAPGAGDPGAGGYQPHSPQTYERWPPTVAEYYRVREPFALTSSNGVPRVCAAGELLASDDPDLKGRERFCEPVASYVERVSETASAAPGEVRAVSSVRRGRRKVEQPVPVVSTPESEL